MLPLSPPTVSLAASGASASGDMGEKRPLRCGRVASGVAVDFGAGAGQRRTVLERGRGQGRRWGQ